MTIIDLYKNEFSSYYPIFKKITKENPYKENPYKKNQLEFSIWQGQIEYNFPILLLFSEYLSRFCKKNNIKYLKFVLRDCCLLFKLFKELYPQFNSELIYCSNYTLNNANKETLDYFKTHCLNPKETIWIDGHGTGESFSKFLDKYKIESPHVMNIYRYWGKQKIPSSYIKKVGLPHYIWLKNINFDLKLGNTFYQMIDNYWDDMIEVFNMDVNGCFNGIENNKVVLKYIEYPVKYAEIGHNSFNCILKNYNCILKSELKSYTNKELKNLVVKISRESHKNKQYWRLRKVFFDL